MNPELFFAMSEKASEDALLSEPKGSVVATDAIIPRRPIEGRLGGVSLFRALLLIGSALTLIGASPHPSPKERGLQTSSEIIYYNH